MRDIVGNAWQVKADTEGASERALKVAAVGVSRL